MYVPRVEYNEKKYDTTKVDEMSFHFSMGLGVK
jgi:hypothetical protein